MVVQHCSVHSTQRVNTGGELVANKSARAMLGPPDTALLHKCGPPRMGNHLIAVSEPCRRSAPGEIRDPKPDGARLEPLKGQDCRSRARRGPSEISIPGDPSPGPAGSMGCRLLPRIPKPAGASESRARRGSFETHVSRDPNPWPAGSTGCLRGGQRSQKPSGTSESRASRDV